MSAGALAAWEKMFLALAFHSLPHPTSGRAAGTVAAAVAAPPVAEKLEGTAAAAPTVHSARGR